ncbi:MAG TPA: hypothetical protein VJ417_11120, partial [Candidatus Glassbacteria bacterium]|nr:hypothetical protein [Candidatus Glassbacteria bacterium]
VAGADLFGAQHGRRVFLFCGVKNSGQDFPGSGWHLVNLKGALIKEVSMLLTKFITISAVKGRDTEAKRRFARFLRDNRPAGRPLTGLIPYFFIFNIP